MPEKNSKPQSIFVIAHTNGEGGHSLPFLAFESAGDARRYCSSANGSYSIVRVPIFPNLPDKPWYQIEETDEQ